ncbi:MAG: gliding motility protein GldN [Bacteroidota bacterium]
MRKKNVFYKDEFEKTYPRQINDTVRSDDIYQYFIIEDYFFDASRSVLDSRIRAICPVRYNNISEKMEPLFWVNFDECRNIFANHTALNSKNDSRKISYDDLFNKRIYNSVITKESNIFDREITDYTKGIESLYEAERIKQSIYNFESDFWQY